MASTAAVATRSAVALRDSGNGQRVQVADVRQQVERAHHARAEEQRLRHVALGLAHLLGEEGDVVPRVGREERLDHGHREGPDERGAWSGRAGSRPQLSLRGEEPSAEDAMQARMRPKQRQQLRHREDVLQSRAPPHARGVPPGEERDEQDRDELDRRETEKAQAQPGLGVHGRHEHAEVLGEADRDGGHRAGLDHEQDRPAVKEAAEVAPRFAQVDVLPARLREGHRQSTVAPGPGYRHREGQRSRRGAGRGATARGARPRPTQ